MSFIEALDPFRNQVIAKYNLESNLPSKIQASREAFQTWKNITLENRISLLKNALQYFEINRKQIAKDITEQMGKPLTQANNEINGFFERANYLLTAAPESLKDDILPEKAGFFRKHVHEPHGIVFVIAAWNYPLLIAVNGVLAALLSGNTVLLKHSSNTIAIGKHFENAFGTIKECKNILQHLILNHEQTSHIITSNQVDHVIFTGSVGGGRKIYESVSKTFIDCQLELGGKDAAYIDANANLEHAAECVVDGAMYNAGQSCCGIERVYVHQNVYEQFLEKCTVLVAKYKLGDPKDATTDMGPLASAKAVNEMDSQIADCVKKGAIIILGGKRKIINQGLFFEPTLIANVDHTMLLMKEENFGPILPIMKVKDANQAIELMNDSDYGLTAAIFTKNEAQALEWCKHIEAGTVFMNRCDYLDPELAWTGYKNSGKGSGLSKYCFHSLTKLKSIHFRKLN